MNNQKHTDAQRIEWILETLHQFGSEGLAKKLHMSGGAKPDVSDIDYHLKAEVRAQPLRALPIADYLRSREGQTWTPADTEEVMRIFRRVDELASDLVQRAREVGR